jgi:hypothetical protein
MKKLPLITLLCLSPLQAISEDFINELIAQQNEQEALTTTRGVFGQQQSKSSIAGGELKTYIVNHVERNLKSQAEALPLTVQKELAAAIQTLANALGKEAQKRKYNALSKEYVENVMQAALKKFFANANNYVDQSNVDQRAIECIDTKFKAAGIEVKPGHTFYNAFSSRKKALLSALHKIMESQQRTYLTTQEIEGVYNTVFDGFIKRVQDHMKWQWVQSKINDFKQTVSKDKALTYIPESGATKLLHDQLKRLK